MQRNDKILLLYADYAVRILASQDNPRLANLSSIRTLDSLRDTIDILLNIQHSIHDFNANFFITVGVCSRTRNYIINPRIREGFYIRYCVREMLAAYGHNSANIKLLLEIAIDPDQYW